MNYLEFLDGKSQIDGRFGFDPIWMPDFLFDFQKSLVEWSLKTGRSAIFADCGLGKTAMQLVWAENVAQKTGKPILILTPLAVSHQTVKEADKFGIEAARSSDGLVYARINITNYEKLHRFNPGDFSGVVCDESSILKSFNGTRRGEITNFMRKIKYRLLCTATASPNDYIELGSSSEALGNLGYMDMLNKFFKNDSNTSDTNRRWMGQSGAAPKWRFRGHAEIPFWRWVCSWARAVRKPSDIGFSDSAFVLPPLIETEHLVDAKSLANGLLFSLPACGLAEQREELKRTIQERCERVTELVGANDGQSIVWCNSNDDGDLLERMISESTQVAGKHTDDEKESRFMDFLSGSARVLITKPKIGGFGLNFQQCSHMTFFPSHSFEQYYQGVRRCWRFGQKNPVKVDIISTEGQLSVLSNLKRKSKQADQMFSNLVSEMNRSLDISRGTKFTKKEELPSWL